jgi:phosphopantothenoylcysteine decarboxylase/phosphopantothenate--cysteine ligase
LPLHDRRILLGVTGGIAAYKAAELTRLLTRRGASVQVVMTRAATAFVAPLTFQALSGHPVHSDLLDPAAESAMGHIALARWPEIILIAPATADFIARVRVGLADDLLSAICLAAEVPLALAPAMNRAMWCHPATTDNVAALRARGIALFGPDAGSQACGETGPGRMLEPAEICAALDATLSAGRLNGRKLLISAGPTREPIDPVRYISNRSSGKMGYALARAATDAGALVTLVSGPTALTVPIVSEFVPVETAEQMAEAVLARAAAHDIYIGAAAIADYRPDHSETRKIKKGDRAMNLSLTRTLDVLTEIGEIKPPPFLVGLAEETDRLEEYARGKLIDKRLDMVAANQVGEMRGGFDSDENALQVYWSGGEQRLTMAPKHLIAKQLIELIADRYDEKSTDQTAR